jgi:hypothetical protein
MRRPAPVHHEARAHGVLTPSTVIKLVPDDSVSKIQFGDTIRLSAAQFKALSAASFFELEARFS